MATQVLIPWLFSNNIYINKLNAENLELSICKFHLTGKKENPIFIYWVRIKYVKNLFSLIYLRKINLYSSVFS